MIKLGVASRQHPAKYPQLPAVSIDQIGTLTWCILTVVSRVRAGNWGPLPTRGLHPQQPTSPNRVLTLASHPFRLHCGGGLAFVVFLSLADEALSKWAKTVTADCPFSGPLPSPWPAPCPKGTGRKSAAHYH